MKWNVFNKFLDGPSSMGVRASSGAYRSPILAMVYWGYALLTLFFSPAALGVLPPLCLFMIHNGMLPDSPVYLVVLGGFTVLLTDALEALLFTPFLRIKRRLPVRTCVGKTFTVTYHVENRSVMAARKLICDPELGIRWFKCREMAVCRKIPAKGQEILTATLTAYRRGRYRLPVCRIVSEFPFGIIRTWCAKRGQDEIIVHPDFTVLRNLVIPVGRRSQNNGLERIVRKSSDAEDFQGCRDYRDGDNPKHIHWQSSARRGALVVKEFQEEQIARTALILDTYLPLKYSSEGLSGLFKIAGNGMLTGVPYIKNLEAAVSLTAALGHYLLKDDVLVDLFATGNRICHFQAGRGTGSFEMFMDVLAEVMRENKPSLDKLSQAVQDEISVLGSCILVLLRYDEDTAEFVEKLRARCRNIKVFVISDHPVERGDCTVVNPEAILSGRITSC